MKALKEIGMDIRLLADKLANTGFEKIFDHIDQLGIKKGVDKYGLDKFIEQSAWMAAGSGIISGSGGLITMLAGVPLDMINIITQQFRITMAILYQRRGNYQIGFDEFMSLVAVSLRVDAGVAITKTVMEEVAEKMLLRIGARTAERLIPIVGAAIGGTANYIFVKRMAETVKKMHFEPVIQPFGQPVPVEKQPDPLIHDVEVIDDDTDLHTLARFLRKRNKGK